jgi:hypothetical protein
LSKLTAEQKVREYNRGQKAAKNGRSRYWSEPSAYPFESDEHYQGRTEAFDQGYRAMTISFGSNSSGKSLAAVHINRRVFLQPNFADQVFERRQEGAIKVELPRESKLLAEQCR